jgi:predicted transcriptional regulator
MSEQDRIELVKLRVSVARMAQAAGVSLFAVNLDPDAPYEVIRAAAETTERGWNALAGEVVDEIQYLLNTINELTTRR